MSSQSDANTFQTNAEKYFTRTSSSDPVFIGPDRIALLCDESGTKQLAVLTISTGDIVNLTNYHEGLISLLGTSASGRIVFGMDSGGNERQQLYVLDSAKDQPFRVTHSDSAFYEPGALSDSGDAVIFRTNERDEGTFDIKVLDIDTGKSDMWLENGGQVTAVDLLGNRALVIRNNGNMDSDLLLVHANEAPKILIDHQDEQWLYGARFDRHSNSIWLLSNIDRQFVALLYLDMDSGERHTVYEADWDIEHFAVSPDGQTIALSVNEAGYSRPVLLSTGDNSDVVSIHTPDGVIDRFSWSPDSSSVAFGISTPESPSGIMLADLSGQTRLITGDEAIAPLTVKPESVSYETWDGRQVPAFLYRPRGAGPFPVLVEIHGGPEGQRRPDYGSNGASIQYITSLGIAVLALNVRGSTGYGKEYCHLDDKGKRLDALKDVEAAVKWLRERDDVIANKIAVYGISYGGFMTLSSLVRYPELWAAGVEMVGMAHLATFLERTGPWRRKHREHEYGSLEHDRVMLDSVSPLPLVDRISAPLMVFHGRQDARVPFYESEQIVAAVEKRGLDVVFRVYEDEGHVFNKRPNLIDAFGLIGEFLTRHLKPSIANT